MYLQYGDYSHNTGECEITTTRSSVYTPRQERWAVRERWNIKGLLLNPSGDLAAMKVLEQALVSAYNYDGYDLTLYFDSGVASSKSMDSSSAVGGLRVVQPVSFPTNSGASAITHTEFTVAVEGLFSTGEVDLVDFHETLSFSGGGPVYGHLETLTGRPVKQLHRRFSTYRAQQHGIATGLTGYPSIPSAIWPNSLMQTREEERRDPQQINGSTLNYTLSWRYSFESAYPITGNPTIR